jgi:hypothetical protein
MEEYQGILSSLSLLVDKKEFQEMLPLSSRGRGMG